MSPRVGVADTKFLAFVAARTCGAHGAFRVPEDVAAFLASHTIDLLPVSADVKRELHRFGPHTLGAVASMGGHMLADRFGPDGKWAWSLCNGIDHSPVFPLVFEESVVEHTSLPFHSSSIDALFVAVDTLLKRAYARRDMRGRYAGAAHLLCAASQIPHLTLSGRHSGRAACVQVTASGHVGQSEVIGRPLVVACWVLAAITCRCGLLSG